MGFSIRMKKEGKKEFERVNVHFWDFLGVYIVYYILMLLAFFIFGFLAGFFSVLAGGI